MQGLPGPERYARLLTRLKALRVARGYSQARVASVIGLSRPQYTHLEAGYCLLDMRHLYALADCYGVAPAALLNEMEGPYAGSGS